MLAARLAGRWLGVAAAIWLVAVCACMLVFWRYKATPGTSADAPSRWPAATTIPLSRERPTLIMFAHPECPCTKASLEELAVVMSRVREKVDAWVLFIRPPGSGPAWDDTATRRQAEQIADVTVRTDVDGRAMEQFGVRTSGQVLLYDSDGGLRFAGGITGVRGHVGDNVGRRRLLAIITASAADAPDAYVFGCGLFR